MPSISVAQLRRVARTPRRLAALGEELVERGAQRRHHVRRRREAPLRGLLHVDVLVVQVERQRMRLPGAGFEQRLARDDEAHARHALEALAAGRDQRVERGLAGVDRQCAERAHRIDDQRLALVARQPRDILESGLRMPVPVSQCTSATCVIAGSAASASSIIAAVAGWSSAIGRSTAARPRYLHIFQRCAGSTRRCSARARGRRAAPACRARPRPRRCRCPAAARRHSRRCRPGRRCLTTSRQMLPVIGVERRVPRAPVAQHRLLGRERGRQWAGGEQDGIIADDHASLLISSRAVWRHAWVRRTSTHSRQNNSAVTTADVAHDQRRHRRAPTDVAGLVEMQDRDRRERGLGRVQEHDRRDRRHRVDEVVAADVEHRRQAHRHRHAPERLVERHLERRRHRLELVVELLQRRHRRQVARRVEVDDGARARGSSSSRTGIQRIGRVVEEQDVAEAEHQAGHRHRQHRQQPDERAQPVGSRASFPASRRRRTSTRRRTPRTTAPSSGCCAIARRRPPRRTRTCSG